jgi:hypothetical protein
VFLDNFKDANKETIKDITVRINFFLHFQYPLLRVNISLEPAKYLKGYNEIFNYLVDSNFIFRAKHITGSALAGQAIEFVNNEVKPNLEALFWSPILTYENLFKSSAKTYKMDRRSYILLRAIRLNFQRVFLNIFKNWSQIRQNRE